MGSTAMSNWGYLITFVKIGMTKHKFTLPNHNIMKTVEMEKHNMFSVREVGYTTALCFIGTLCACCVLQQDLTCPKK